MEIVCADNDANRPEPEEGLPEGLCAVRGAFEAEVAVDPGRVPAGATGPFVARVNVVAEDGGAIVASVVEDGSSSADPATTGGAAILSTGG